MVGPKNIQLAEILTSESFDIETEGNFNWSQFLHHSLCANFKHLGVKFIVIFQLNLKLVKT